MTDIRQDVSRALDPLKKDLLQERAEKISWDSSLKVRYGACSAVWDGPVHIRGTIARSISQHSTNFLRITRTRQTARP